MKTFLHSFKHAMASRKYDNWHCVLRLLVDIEKQNSVELAKLGDDIANIGNSEERFTVASFWIDFLDVG